MDEAGVVELAWYVVPAMIGGFVLGLVLYALCSCLCCQRHATDGNAARELKEQVQQQRLQHKVALDAEKGRSAVLQRQLANGAEQLRQV